MFQRIKAEFRKNRLRILMFCLMYTAIFFAFFLVTGIYSASENQLQFLQEKVGNSVKIKKYTRWEGIRDEEAFEGSDVDTLTESPYVRGYSLSIASQLRFADMEPVGEQTMEEMDGNAQGVTNSEDMRAFTRQGFELVSGRHITEEDAENHVVMISRELAEKNGIKTGDEIAVESDGLFEEFYGFKQSGTYKVCGIFDYPEVDEDRQGIGSSEWERGNTIFLPLEAMRETFEWARIYDVTVFLNDINDVEKYKEETEKELFTGGTYETEFVYFWDEDWEETVAQPMLRMKRMSGILLLILFIGTIAQAGLLGVLSLRRRQKEARILLNMGEKRWKVIFQFFCQEMTPVVIALVLACGIGSLCARPVAGWMADRYIVQTNEINDMSWGILWEEAEDSYLTTMVPEYETEAGDMVRIHGEIKPPILQMTIASVGLAVFLGVITVFFALGMTKRSARRGDYE